MTDENEDKTQDASIRDLDRFFVSAYELFYYKGLSECACLIVNMFVHLQLVILLIFFLSLHTDWENVVNACISQTTYENVNLFKSELSRMSLLCLFGMLVIFIFHAFKSLRHYNELFVVNSFLEIK